MLWVNVRARSNHLARGDTMRWCVFKIIHKCHHLLDVNESGASLVSSYSNTKSLLAFWRCLLLSFTSRNSVELSNKYSYTQLMHAWCLPDPIVSAPYLYVQYKVTMVSNFTWKRCSKVSTLKCKLVLVGKISSSFDCLAQVNFAIGQVKMEGWWSGGQVKFASQFFSL